MYICAGIIIWYHNSHTFPLCTLVHSTDSICLISTGGGDFVIAGCPPTGDGAVSTISGIFGWSSSSFAPSSSSSSIGVRAVSYTHLDVYKRQQ